MPALRMLTKSSSGNVGKYFLFQDYQSIEPIDETIPEALDQIQQELAESEEKLSGEIDKLSFPRELNQAHDNLLGILGNLKH